MSINSAGHNQMIQKIFRRSILNVLVFSLFMTYPFISQAQEKPIKTGRPKITLVLSGGGAKGFAHIGVLTVLEKEEIPIDLIVETSMGGLVGGIYSLGYNASELEGLVKSFDWETTLTDEIPRVFLSKNDQLIKQRYIFSLQINGDKKLSLPQRLIKGQNILNFFCGIVGNVPLDADFSKFRIPFLPTSMFSSTAIPLPFQSADRTGRLLIDGGIVNNIPTDVAKKMGADIIIGADIMNDFFDQENLKSPNNVLGQLVNFFDQAKDSTNKSLCNMIIRPDISGYSNSSFNEQAVDALIYRGVTVANGFREQLRKLRMKYQLDSLEKSRELVKLDRWHITNLIFTGNYHLDSDFLRKTIALEPPGNFSSDEIKTTIDKLSGLGGFDRIYYNLIDIVNGETLNLNISPQEVFTENIGFKANTTDAAAILINTKKTIKMFLDCCRPVQSYQLIRD